jgi:hypothetical protein
MQGIYFYDPELIKISQNPTKPVLRELVVVQVEEVGVVGVIWHGAKVSRYMAKFKLPSAPNFRKKTTLQ